MGVDRPQMLGKKLQRPSQVRLSSLVTFAIATLCAMPVVDSRLVAVVPVMAAGAPTNLKSCHTVHAGFPSLQTKKTRTMNKQPVVFFALGLKNQHMNMHCCMTYINANVRSFALPTSSLTLDTCNLQISQFPMKIPIPSRRKVTWPITLLMPPSKDGIPEPRYQLFGKNPQWNDNNFQFQECPSVG